MNCLFLYSSARLSISSEITRELSTLEMAIAHTIEMTASNPNYLNCVYCFFAFSLSAFLFSVVRIWNICMVVAINKTSGSFLIYIYSRKKRAKLSDLTIALHLVWWCAHACMFYRLIVHKFRSISMLIDVDQITFNHIINLYQSFTIWDWNGRRFDGKRRMRSFCPWLLLLFLSCYFVCD